MKARNKIRYGTSGNPPNFFESKFGKDRRNALDWIDNIGLNAYEYMMTYGARTKEKKARYLGEKSKDLDIDVSVHGPYYVVLNSKKKEVQERSIKRMLKTIRLADMMNAKKIVFHPGFGDDIKSIVKNLKIIEKDKPENIKLLPETMGKKSQTGSLNEVLEICEKTACEPCIDFGHLHARNLGSLKREEDFREVLEEVERRLGSNVLKRLHCHFYPVEFTSKGEKEHRAVMEKDVYPRFEPLSRLIREFEMKPTLISESKNSQDIGALKMKRIMEEGN